MQKSHVSLLVLMLLLCVSSVVSAGASSSRTIVVGVYDNPPKIRTTLSGKPDSFFIDILEGIAKKQHWNFLYEYGDWIELLERLRDGRIDVLPDVAYSTGRAEYLDFCKIPVLSSWVHVLVNKGTNFMSFKDLDGKNFLCCLARFKKHYARN